MDLCCVKCWTLNVGQNNLLSFQSSLLCFLQKLTCFLACFRIQRPWKWPKTTSPSSNPLWYCADYGLIFTEQSFNCWAFRLQETEKLNTARRWRKRNLKKHKKRWKSTDILSPSPPPFMHSHRFCCLKRFSTDLFLPFSFLFLSVYTEGEKKVHSHFYENVDWGWSPSVQTVWDCDFLFAFFSIRGKTSLLR